MRLAVLPLLAIGLAPTAAPAAAPSLTFERDVRSIFKAHCFECHGETKQLKGELDLRLKRFLVSGGESGAAIVPGKPDASLLIERVAAGDMPPGTDSKKLTPAQIDVIRRWIEAFSSRNWIASSGRSSRSVDLDFRR